MKLLKNKKIEKQDHFGRGIIHDEEKIIFVENALKDEIGDILITLENKKYKSGRVVEFHKTSLNRTSVDCPYYDKCGGCQLLHQNYLSQLTFKENKVKEIMKKFANISLDKIKAILGSEQFSYRNKVVYHIKKDKLGFYRDKTNNLISIEHCLLVDDLINEVTVILKEYIKTHHNLTGAMIRVGNKTKEILLSLKGDEKKEDLIDCFMGKVDTLIYNDEVLFGNNYINSKLFNHTFKVSSPSFFQVNVYQTEVLYQLVIDRVKEIKPKIVLDLYCGTGTIGLLVSSYVDKVIGIEIIKEAIDNARENQKLNSRENISFYVGKVEEKLEEFKNNIDLVIVDPPRSGLDSKVIDVLLEMKTKDIIYISCDPVTLARDLNKLQSHYEIETIQPVDMFPNTYHVECVCVLKLK